MTRRLVFAGFVATLAAAPVAAQGFAGGYEQERLVQFGLGGGAIIDGKKGALIGAAVGAGGGLLASRGTDDVDLPEGTLLTLRLDSAMTYARR